jgi:Lrp/AsnC family transcriptional regulator, regulator for asnA, asnC and gidA
MPARDFTPEEKLQVVLAGLRNEMPIAQLCEHYEISEATYYNWQRSFLTGAREGLGGTASPRAQDGSGTVDLDDVSRMLILLLQRDGRLSLAELAKQVGAAEGTVRRKFNRLLEEGVIRIAAVTDPFKVGVEAPVSIGLRVEPIRIREVVARLAELPQVRKIVGTAGEHDIIVECYFPSRRELNDFLTDRLGQLPGIQNRTISLLLTIYKESFDWGLPGSTV